MVGVVMETKKTIMIVDDNPDIVTIVKGILDSKGYTVLCAYSGEEVFDQLAAQTPDLIILDIMMPQMDGLQVLGRLKSTATTAGIPVIMLTARNKYEDVLEAYQRGTDYYISKPFTSTQLVNGVHMMLNDGEI
jgi:DNA-binding response OmpR family regulator